MLGFETEIEIEARLPAKAKNVTVWALQMHSIDRIDIVSFANTLKQSTTMTQLRELNKFRRHSDVMLRLLFSLV